MRRTLFLIPHEIGPLPVFGLVSWMMILVCLGIMIRLVWPQKEKLSLTDFFASEGWLYLIAVAVIGWVLPRVELQNVMGQPVGMAIRGYGVMLLAGVGSAIALAAYRAKKRGLDPDLIYSMAPWAFIGGIVGARLFYVIQYRQQFVRDSFTETMAEVLSFTEGGLVVYGSFIGGGLAVLYFLIRHRLSPLKFGDIIVPCLFLGVFFGRMGCLLNGCCYGGRCEPGPIAVQFPPQAKVYADQIQSGELIGLKYDGDRNVIAVEPGSIADQKGIEVGDTLVELQADYSSIDDSLNSESARTPFEDLVAGLALDFRRRGTNNQGLRERRVRIPASEMPKQALPVRAAQIISSVSSLVLCIGLCLLSAINLRTGTVMFAGFAAYAILRFVLEIVRVDEAGQFGTTFSISQWVSMIVLTGSIAGMAWLYWSGQDKSPTVLDSPNVGSRS